jgi:hypothetical protein
MYTNTMKRRQVATAEAKMSSLTGHFVPNVLFDLYLVHQHHEEEAGGYSRSQNELVDWTLCS